LAGLQRTAYPHSGHPLAEGRAQDRVSSQAKDRHSANCAMQPNCCVAQLCNYNYAVTIILFSIR